MLDSKAAMAVTIGAGLMLSCLPVGAARSTPQSELTIRITNIRNAQGEVRAEVCPQASFLRDDCRYAASAPARPGVALLTVRGIPPGRYAVQAFHDENGNHRVDRALFGIPREGVAFSNDAPIRFGPPKWADAAFAFTGGEQAIQMKARYFMGPSGPALR
ncbi:MAG: DUF2141 domain-containing protein [Novosphingobium sp.]